ncbi:hypothetical protein [Maribacter sp.]|uniref:hypothetical protein n=1 Tax=Maribacter sp. TaxID=1897614 RepID=UPI0025C71A7A|nr:hypothetical protein [Maribacter sp.]
MNIKKTIFVVVCLIGFASNAQHKPNHEKIKALKIAYLTEKLDLTSKEAQEFWPIYNAHEKKIHKIRQQERKDIHESLESIEQLSEKEINKLLELDLSLEEKKHGLHKKFVSDIRKVISAKKTFILLQSENGFKRKLLRQYHQKNKSGNK